MTIVRSDTEARPGICGPAVAFFVQDIPFMATTGSEMPDLNALTDNLQALEAGKLCHIGFVVPKMERALTQWLNTGAQIIIPPTEDPVQRVNCALVSFAGSVPIELVAPLGDVEESPVAARLKRGGGMDHICMFTDDMNMDIARHQEAGALLVVKPVYGCVFDRQIAFLQLRTGLVLELMNRLPEGRQPTATSLR